MVNGQIGGLFDVTLGSTIGTTEALYFDEAFHYSSSSSSAPQTVTALNNYVMKFTGRIKISFNYGSSGRSAYKFSCSVNGTKKIDEDVKMSTSFDGRIYYELDVKKGDKLTVELGKGSTYYYAISLRTLLINCNFIV